MIYRERWFAERGLSYEPPRLFHCPPFRCVGTTANVGIPALRQAELPMREPGQDDEEREAA